METRKRRRPCGRRAYRQWTPAEESRLLNLWVAGKTWAQVSLALHRSANACQARLAKCIGKTTLPVLPVEVEICNLISRLQAIDPTSSDADLVSEKSKALIRELVRF